MTTITRPVIKQIFIRFTAIFGHAWNSLYPSEGIYKLALAEWNDSLKNFSDEQIMRGVDVAKNSGSEFAPSLPAFVKMCKPSLEAIGLPSWEEAMQLAIRRDFKHPIIQQVFDQISSFNFSSMADKELRPRFRKIYEDLIVKEQERVMMLEAKADLLIDRNQHREIPKTAFEKELEKIKRKAAVNATKTNS